MSRNHLKPFPLVIRSASHQPLISKNQRIATSWESPFLNHYHDLVFSLGLRTIVGVGYELYSKVGDGMKG